ncbi:MAG: C10 family peptidase [Bacteroidetes bacterium]|nr:C10 family peptidase [Bacteroidota bacterium]
MQKIKLFKLLLFLVVIGVINYSCNKDEDIETGLPLDIPENFVSMEEASDIGNHFRYPISFTSENSNLKSSQAQKKKIESINKITDDTGETTCYVINYENGGFIILSADKRAYPILAFSETSFFDVDLDKFPFELSNWMENKKNKIKEIRKSNLPQKKETEIIWDNLDKQKAPLPGDDDDDGEVDPCQDVHTHIGPLLETTWWQLGGFNDAVSLICTGGEQAPAGCVAVAAAQVMRYHEYPDRYNWSNMPNTYATAETAALIAEIGNKVVMWYSCESSGAETENLLVVFDHFFGYSTPVYAPFNRSVVIGELNHGRPVILRGKGTEGHTWVCDGYLRSTFCESGASYLSLNMNWGWEDGDYNGFYSYDDWTPGGDNYNDDKYMITNIIP